MSDLQPVLSIGLSGHAGLTAAQLGQLAKGMAKSCLDFGIDFDARFVHAPMTREERSSLLACLRSKPWKIVAIGSSLRLIPDNTRGLEDVLDMVLSAVHPAPRLAFPTLPEEMIPTFRRLLDMSNSEHVSLPSLK